MPDYKIRLECCGRIVRMRLPSGVRAIERSVACMNPKCVDGTDDWTWGEASEWTDKSRILRMDERKRLAALVM